MDAFWAEMIDVYRAWLAGAAAAGEHDPSPPPPREVRWCWLAHMLQPKAYAADCASAFGRVLPHSNRTPIGGSAAAGVCPTFTAWWARWVGAAYPLAGAGCARPTLSLDWCKSLDSESTMRAEVLEQVAGRGVDFASDDAEAERVLLDYRRFVHATAVMSAGYNDVLSCHGANLAPGPLVDLAWHSHMSDPTSYNNDQRERTTYLDHEPCSCNMKKPLVLGEPRQA